MKIRHVIQFGGPGILLAFVLSFISAYVSLPLPTTSLQYALFMAVNALMMVGLSSVVTFLIFRKKMASLFVEEAKLKKVAMQDDSIQEKEDIS